MPERATLRAYLGIATLERSVLTGASLAVIGLSGLAWVTLQWVRGDFHALEYSSTMRVLIPSVTAISVGIQTALAGFFSSILDLTRRTLR
jgi:hypothetical protein